MGIPRIVPALTEAWHRFWFTHGNARQLGAIRVIVTSHALWMVLSRNYASYAALPDAFWTRLAPSAQLRYGVVVGTPAIDTVLQGLAIVALVSALIGFAPRISCFFAGMILYHLAPLETLSWTTEPTIRGMTIGVPALILLSFSRCGDSATAFKKDVPADVSPELDYSWQIRGIHALVCAVYLFSAYSKFRTSGLGWVSAENMTNWLLWMNQNPDVPTSTIGLWIASTPLLAGTVGVATLAFEAVFVAILWKPRLWAVFVPTGILFHLGIAVTLQLTFPAMPLLLAFVPWHRFFGHSAGPDQSQTDLNSA